MPNYNYEIKDGKKWYVGLPGYLNSYLGNNFDSIVAKNFEPLTQYTISFYGYAVENTATAKFWIHYTDGTKENL